MRINYQISPNDLELNDQDLFMKIYENETETQEIEDLEILQDEITRKINVARNRFLCFCGGFGRKDNKKCKECNGSGFLKEIKI